MHSGKNGLNDRKSENYVKSDRAEETGTFRQKKTKRTMPKRCGGKNKS